MDQAIGVGVMTGIFLLIIAIPVTICALLFTAFRRVPERHRLMNPAFVWLLMIPCFNVVFNFFVYPRLSRSLSSAYRAGGRSDVGSCGYGLGIAYAVCIAVTAVPILGVIAGLTALVLVIIYLVKVLGLSRDIPPPVDNGIAVPEPAKRSDTGLVIAMAAAGAIGLLFVMGIIAAIAIPNLLNAIDRGKQKRTMSDMRTVATAIESYYEDEGKLPISTSVDDLEGKLAPKYLPVMPKRDGWSQPIGVEVMESGYTLTSAGKDGKPDGCAPGPSESFDADICLVDGEFVRYPEGQQH